MLNKLELLRGRGKEFDSFDNRFRQQMEAIRYQLKNGPTSDEAFDSKMQRIQDDRTSRHLLADSSTARQLLKQQLSKVILAQDVAVFFSNHQGLMFKANFFSFAGAGFAGQGAGICV